MFFRPSKKRNRQKISSLEKRIAIEKRMLFDAAALITTAEVSTQSDGDTSEANGTESKVSQTENQQISDLLSTVGSDQSQQLYVIDASLPDLNAIEEQIPDGSQILYISANESGVDLLSDFLTDNGADYSAVHILTHASSEGSFELGTDSINQDTILSLYHEQLQNWSQSLSSDADVFIYGCDLAQSEAGQNTLLALSNVLSADIAASDDTTGVDGDWDLEYILGEVEQPSLAVENWQSNLLLLDVDDIVDGAVSSLDGLLTINLPTLTPVSEDQGIISLSEGGNSISVGNLNSNAVEVTLLVPKELGNLSFNDDPQSLNVEVSTDQETGLVTLKGASDDVNTLLAGLLYTPEEDYNGPVNLTVSLTALSDALLPLLDLSLQPIDSLSITLPIIEIAAVVDIVDDSIVVVGNDAVSFNVLANDTFENLDATVTAVTQPQNGEVSIGNNGVIIYTPNADYHGSDSFDYTVTSGGVTETATVYVDVINQNVNPQITLPVDLSVAEEQTIVFSSTNTNAISVNDLNGDLLTVTLSTSDGVVSLSQLTGLTLLAGTGTNDSSVTFSGSISDINAALEGLSLTPNADFFGQTSLAIEVSDGELTVNDSVGLTYSGVTDGVEDSVRATTNASIEFSPLSNDNFENTAVITAVGSAANGTVTLGENNQVTYTPEADFSGQDSFTYAVTSGGAVEIVNVEVLVGNQDSFDLIDLGLLQLNDGQLVLLDTSLGFVDSGIIGLNAYSAVGLPDGLAIDSVTGIISGVLAADASTAITNGSYDVTVTAQNLLGDSVDLDLTLNVVNPPPLVSTGVSLNALEDQNLNIDILANASDPDGDTITIDNNSVTAVNGTVSVLEDGTFDYQPNANFNGIDTINYTVVDSDGATTDGVINVVVTAVVDLPTISIPTIDVFDEDTPLVFADVLGQQISIGDIDGDILEVELNVPLGSLSFSETVNVDISESTGANQEQILTLSGSAADIEVALNKLVYTPGADYNGEVTIDVALGQLGQALSVTAEIPLGIRAVADIVDDTYSVQEQGSLSVNVLDNDTFENETRTVKEYTTSAYGTVSIDSSGNLNYTPNVGFTGDDIITYTVESNGTLETASITISVIANQAPDAVDDTATTNEDTAVIIDVLSNDSDVEGQSLTITQVSLVSGEGSISIVNNQLVFTPSTNFNGTATINYTVSDGMDTSTALVTVMVNPVNDGPQAVNDNATTAEETVVTIDVLANDTDVDGDTLTISDASVPPEQGSVAIVNGQLEFTPAADFVGNASISYTISDGTATSSAVATVVVTNVNDGPVASDDTGSTNEDTTVTLDVLANDTDADGNALTISSVSIGEGQGSVSIVDNEIVYTPAANFNGTANISYTISDGTTTDTANVTVTVVAVNDGPQAVNDNATTAEETVVTIDVLANDTDVDGDTLTI
ncbi:Ig-like domain-containing protein, partial [Vibrio sp. HB161653]